MIVTHVDDCLIFCKDKKVLEELITSLKDEFKLTDEGNLSAFLSAQFKKSGNQLETSQPHLIECIVEALNLNNEAKMRDAPENAIHGRDDDGKKHMQTWNYHSVIGMMNYLVATSRPDALYAVHQCARCALNLKISCEEAIKHVGRYLKRIKDKGVIFAFDATKGIEVYVDADCARTWNISDSNKMMSALSRTGCAIKIANCLIIWVSKMQTEVALSTTEAEHITLLQSTREFIPLKNILEHLSNFVKVINREISAFSTIFEDNAGVLQLANEPKCRPRAKRICIKYHHFCQHVKDKTITIRAIDANEQQTDIFSKPLPLDKFRKFRKALIGW